MMILNKLKKLQAHKNIKLYVYIGFFGIFNSLINISILNFLNQAIQSKSISFLGNYSWVAYFLTIVIAYFSNKFFQRQILDFSYTKLFKYEQKILKTIRESQLKDIEKIGSDKIYSVLEDIRVFIFAPTLAISAINAVSTILISLVYLFYVSPIMGLVIVGMIGMLCLVYLLLNKKNLRRVAYTRNLHENYFQLIEDALKGFKQLKLSTAKSGNLFDKHIKDNRLEIKNLETVILDKLMTINLFGTYGLYILFGLILFILPMVANVPHESVASYVVILLFMSGSIAGLFSMQQMLSKMYVSNTKIQSFLKEMEAVKPVKIDNQEELNSTFETIELNDVIFEQKSIKGSVVFRSGPINLSINRGETIFVIGGNGSGKSTFINLLTNLYKPVSGNLAVDDTVVGANSIEYRDLISSIYTDHHLFSRNYENYNLEGNLEYMMLLKRMKLEEIIENDSDESARRQFSKGQSKRMALIFALLEKKPILVLDEWAADQDPVFRKYFYENLIPELKKEGKTIIAVTHDDAYFKYADRIIKFDEGKIVKEFVVNESYKNEEILF